MIGETMKVARKMKGMTQEEMAVKLNVVRQTVSKWENGLSVPDADVLLQIADLLDVSVSQLLGVELPGNAVPELTRQLAQLNEELAIKSKRERLFQRANRKRGLILFLSFVVMLIALAVQNETVSAVLTGSCVLVSLIILYRNLALLTNITAEDGKMRALRVTTVFDILLIVLVFSIVILNRMSLITISQEGEKTLAAGITVTVMVFGGLIAPKLPFSRHTGLRLPWTVQDEDTWNAAHQILGFISLPIALLYLAAFWTISNLEAVIWIAVMLWVGIPGIMSLIFFWRKTHGKL